MVLQNIKEIENESTKKEKNEARGLREKYNPLFKLSVDLYQYVTQYMYMYYI